MLARFETLLEVAQRYAALREEQARWFTLGWPLLRRCALRLVETIRSRGAVDRAEDVFFLTRAELHGPAHLQEAVSRRRAERERRRRLIAPLTIGTAPLVERAIRSTVNAVRTGSQVPDGAIVGQPASPGRPTSPVRIVRGPEDFDHFRPGEVLVARTTAPAWTPLFGRAAAVVTDGAPWRPTPPSSRESTVSQRWWAPATPRPGYGMGRWSSSTAVPARSSHSLTRRAPSEHSTLATEPPFVELPRGHQSRDRVSRSTTWPARRVATRSITRWLPDPVQGPARLASAATYGPSTSRSVRCSAACTSGSGRRASASTVYPV